ncbi:MAG: type II toxin-antitoxin system HicA family toxin [Candidatus Kapabacteria bacterium]|nr:type II toxin-antitoxin system HicA family toxin [Candidatus Kapabacteria bacterium]
MKPCKRREFIRKLKLLGFDGPFSGSKHQFMNINNCRLTIPSNDEFSGPQIKMMLREINLLLNNEITNSFWDKL